LLLLLLALVLSALVLEEYFFSAAMRGSLCLCLCEEEEEEEEEEADMKTEKNNSLSLSLSLSLKARFVRVMYRATQTEGEGVDDSINKYEGREGFLLCGNEQKTATRGKKMKKMRKKTKKSSLLQRARLIHTLQHIARGARLKTTHISFVYIYDKDNSIRLQKEG